MSSKGDLTAGEAGTETPSHRVLFFRAKVKIRMDRVEVICLLAVGRALLTLNARKSPRRMDTLCYISANLVRCTKLARIWHA